MTTTSNPPVLCYVDGSWAFFTTQPLEKQWGDDWNDAPYEHNAGEPYAFGSHDQEKGKEPWEITRVAWLGSFETPCAKHWNSPWSVEQINAGAVPWLRSSEEGGDPIVIPAGTTMERFCELICQGGGKFYLEPRILPRLVRRCPACDSRAEFYTGATGTAFVGKWMVSCAAQDSNFHGEPDVSEDWCPAGHGSETAWCSTPEQAAEEWEKS